MGKAARSSEQAPFRESLHASRLNQHHSRSA